VLLDASKLKELFPELTFSVIKEFDLALLGLRNGLENKVENKEVDDFVL
jgi:hypothetical protein